MSKEHFDQAGHSDQYENPRPYQIGEEKYGQPDKKYGFGQSVAKSG